MSDFPTRENPREQETGKGLDDPACSASPEEDPANFNRDPGNAMTKAELFEAFEAKLADCRRRAKECYECRDEDCSEIGKYWDAATIEIQRFKQELLFPQNDKDMPRREPK